ncbi:hypothetical protein [Actinoplanes couchii]|uniref:Uncharacterized protein n=1 Tax=Actinoplanes couchii TaxID=403638 RepID=A0ABQ3XLB1_9ACTN|nr:hypothetical protein [Actinoplanes couchii]MDR6318344.1 hypothetical protein [Actinoplanes couchii]GID59288.1 hypothetical protein Aco03nite_076920 [Actinoplanes couchii]
MARRARVHAEAGRPLSAVADAQQALLGCLSLASGPLRSPARIAVARVAAHVAQVQLLIDGDTDLTAGAADFAIREVVGGLGPGDPLQLSPIEADLLVRAGMVAVIMHTAAGRPTLAEAAGQLVGLEAHALFAWASQQGDVSMRHQFPTFGVDWLSAVVNFGQRHAEQELWPAAVDAAAWLTGIVGQLAPFAIVDTGVQRNVLAILDWQEGIFTATGDPAAAARVAEVRTTVRASGGPG